MVKIDLFGPNSGKPICKLTFSECSSLEIFILSGENFEYLYDLSEILPISHYSNTMCHIKKSYICTINKILTSHTYFQPKILHNVARTA